MARKKTGSLYKKTPDAAKWTGAYVDPFDRKRRTMTLFTDYRASQVRLQELITLSERKATGLEDRYAEQRQRPIADHVTDYLDHCRHIGESPVHVKNKETQLRRMVTATAAARLTDLEPNKVEQHLQVLSKQGRVKRGDRSPDKGLSARSVNQHRATVVAFVQWCVQTNRLPANPLRLVPKLDERRDRRRVRRAFDVGELERLLAVAPTRRAVYLVAVLTGLRRRELKLITWGDADLERGQIRVRVGVGKAAREDHVSLHPDALAELRRLRPPDPKPTDRVFGSIPRDKTFRADLKRAKIAGRDSEDRCVDFHALRTTTGTLLAKSGVMPQVATKVMRHSDMRLTLKHYTDLRLHDEARAVASMPRIGAGPRAPESQRATGTEGAPVAADPGRSVEAPEEAQRAPKAAPAFGMVQSGRKDGPTLRLAAGRDGRSQTRYTSGLSTPVRKGASVKGTVNRKPFNDNLLGAIGAVG